MKVALVNHTFSSSHGGLERFSLNLATALHAHGHEVHAFAQRMEGLPEGIVRHTITSARRPAWWRPLSFQRHVRRSLAGQEFDIVYGLTRFFPLDLYRMGDGVQRHWLRLRYPFAPWRWLNCLLNPVHLVNLYLERRVMQAGNCRHIVTNSHLCREHASRYYGVNFERVRVVYNGVDHALFNPNAVRAFRAEIRSELGLADRDLMILYVSNNWKRKGLAVILKALALLGERGENLHIVVVGRGRPGSFRKLAERLGLAHRLHIVGATSEIQKYYGAGDLLVLPTLYDPFANVCLEAMACGLPVISTTENGASELINSGRNGYVQRNATDSVELAALLEACLDRNRLRAMGECAHRTALPFTREQNMRENLDLFRELLERSGV